MEAAGVTLLEHTDRLAVMGFLEVLAHIPMHWRLLSQLKARLKSGRVGLVVLIDYPGFNMKVAAAAKAAGVPVLYYITPQVWAWGAKRKQELSQTITRAAVILPFEEADLRGARHRRHVRGASAARPRVRDPVASRGAHGIGPRPIGAGARALSREPRGARSSGTSRSSSPPRANWSGARPGCASIVSVAPRDHAAAGAVPVPAGARELLRGVARGRRGALQERHVHARGGGGRLPAGGGVPHERGRRSRSPAAW